MRLQVDRERFAQSREEVRLGKSAISKDDVEDQARQRRRENYAGSNFKREARADL